MRALFIVVMTLALMPSVLAAPPPPVDPIALPLGGAGGALVGGLVGSGGALALALAAQNATGDDITSEARTLNQLATFGTLVAPALLSVGGAVVGAGLSGGLVGALVVGFGATMGAAAGTAIALVAVPVGAAASSDLPGGALGATAAIGGIVVGAAAVGAAIAGIVGALTIDPTLNEIDDAGGPRFDGDEDWTDDTADGVPAPAPIAPVTAPAAEAGADTVL